jgi:GH35 family endo-1,4-beta-xylanase
MKKRIMAGLTIVVFFSAGCTAMNPQQAARQQAESYYNRPYEQLTTEEKMRLENHLARQNNTAWRTNAQVANGVGRLLQGVGILVFGAR